MMVMGETAQAAPKEKALC